MLEFLANAFLGAEERRPYFSLSTERLNEHVG